jgi:hypothetical protein
MWRRAPPCTEKQALKECSHNFKYYAKSVRRITMANKKFLLVFCVLAGLLFFSCATTSSIGGTVDKHGLISSANQASFGGEEIASYGVILGLFDTGYEGYVSAVNKAEAEGKTIVSVTTDYFGYYTKVTAYAK